MQAIRISALLLVIGISLPSLAMAQYGLDEVPNSTFSHHHDWRHFGTDPVPSTRKHTDGLTTTFGVDRIPGVIRESSDLHPDHELIHETIQHLTGAVEYTPGARKAATKPSKTPQAAVPKAKGKAAAAKPRTPNATPSR